jgi:hypothetical protein
LGENIRKGEEKKGNNVRKKGRKGKKGIKIKRKRNKN